MTINSDLVQGAVAPLPERLDRQDAQARQDRWMLELERASLASSAKKLRNAQPLDGAAAAQAPSLPADAAPAAATAGPRAAGASTGADAAGPGPHGQGAAMPSPALRMAAVHAGVLTTHAAAMSAGVPAAAPAPAAAAPSSATPAADVDAVAQHPAGAPLTAFGLAPLPDQGAQAGVELPEPPAYGAEPPADGTQFDKRLMHLFAATDGTHAYIRDAELGAAQARSVAMALGAALADSGQPLTALTVNGKRVSLANHPMPGAVPAGAPFNVQPLTLVRKEFSK